MSRQILHVDMDAFYASVEQRDDPALRGKPVIVGGGTHRGVVAAASYEVRPFGVRSAMSMGEAMRRCPHAIVVSPRHDHYSDVSRKVFAIFHRFTPLVEGLSLDEAFLDVTASRSLYGDGATIAAAIKKAIRDEVSLNASAGVAPCKFVAKIASDLKKPDGLCVIREDEIPSVLWPLPIERMWGIGPKSAPRAHAAGFHTLGDLARADPARLERAFGDWGPEMARLARGEDAREVEPGRDAKSVGAEETFDRDLHTHEEIAAKLLGQSARVASRLFAEGTAGRGVTVKLKYADFTIKTRAMQLPEAVCDTRSIFRAARTLLDRFELRGRGVRLSGVSVSALAPIDHVRTLFPDPEVARSTKIEAALASLRDRFGSKVRPATLLVEGRGRDGDDEHGGR